MRDKNVISSWLLALVLLVAVWGAALSAIYQVAHSKRTSLLRRHGEIDTQPRASKLVMKAVNSQIVVNLSFCVLIAAWAACAWLGWRRGAPSFTSFVAVATAIVVCLALVSLGYLFAFWPR